MVEIHYLAVYGGMEWRAGEDTCRPVDKSTRCNQWRLSGMVSMILSHFSFLTTTRAAAFSTSWSCNNRHDWRWRGERALWHYQWTE